MYRYYYGGDGTYFLAIIAVMLIGFAVQARMNSIFAKYSKVPSQARMQAFRVAQALLQQEGSPVVVTPVAGRLTDHFNPKTNVVGLSEAVYNESSVAALAVAAHEIGHVMQYERGYIPIRIRNAILPVARFGSQLAPLIIILGILMNMFNLMYVGIILFGAFFLFQIVTLPVEFNASRQALAMLEAGNYISYDESDMARKVLRAASMTYVVAALASFVTLLRYLGMARRR